SRNKHDTADWVDDNHVRMQDGFDDTGKPKNRDEPHDDRNMDAWDRPDGTGKSETQQRQLIEFQGIGEIPKPLRHVSRVRQRVPNRSPGQRARPPVRYRDRVWSPPAA